MDFELTSFELTLISIYSVSVHRTHSFDYLNSYVLIWKSRHLHRWQLHSSQKISIEPECQQFLALLRTETFSLVVWYRGRNAQILPMRPYSRSIPTRRTNTSNILCRRWISEIHFAIEMFSKCNNPNYSARKIQQSCLYVRPYLKAWETVNEYRHAINAVLFSYRWSRNSCDFVVRWRCEEYWPCGL